MYLYSVFSNTMILLSIFSISLKHIKNYLYIWYGDELSWVPGIHVKAERENQLDNVTSALHTWTVACAYLHSHIHIMQVHT